MPELVPVLRKSEIEAKVAALASAISAEYAGRELVLLGVLKGAFVFMADLARHLTIPVVMDFVRVCSYGAGTCSSGRIELTKSAEVDLAGKDVLLVEDIVDTGLTLDYLIGYCRSQNCRSVKVCALIDKRERRAAATGVDYAGCVVHQGFLVGYGLDFNERYRELPEIYHLKQ